VSGNDSVWVFVDYNTQGTMKRLPLTGATASTGTVRRPNDQGAWVVAPGGAGAFSATVTLSSGTTYSYGSCAYAIPQPPKGEYTAYDAVKFTGTPPFELTFAAGGGSVSVPTAAYTIPAGKTLASFTDATRAPGVFACTTPTITKQPNNSIICSNTPAHLDIMASPAAAYRWYKEGAPVSESSGTTSAYITDALTATANYSVTAAIGACSVTSSAVVSMSTVTQCCNNEGVTYTKPDATASFKDFSPCSATPVGAAWYLTDTRDSKTYKVVMMPDNRAWMAQNLNYQQGLTFNSSSSYANGSSFTSGKNGAPAIGSFWCPGGTSASSTKTSVIAGCDVWGGALYTWEPAMALDGKGAVVESSTKYHASATAAAVVATNNGRTSAAGNVIGGRGICPENWHVPTSAEWCALFDTMEDSGNIHSSSGIGMHGVVAGARAKATATCSEDNCPSDSIPAWRSATPGTDRFGLRGLPAGGRSYVGTDIGGRGLESVWWCASTAWNEGGRIIGLVADEDRMNHVECARAFGFSVRCVRD
jgi:uncharacterized protein (TIGR02145 family)